MARKWFAVLAVGATFTAVLGGDNFSHGAIVTISGAANVDDVRLMDNLPLDDIRRNSNGGGVDSGTMGNGNNNTIENYFLFRFDLSSLSGQTANGDAIVRLTHSHNANATAGDLVQLFQLFDTNAGWLEGSDLNTNTNVSAEASSGLVTFANFGEFNSSTEPGSPDVPWKDAGGANVAGLTGAYDGGSPIDSVDLAGISTARDTTFDFTIPQATIQDWIDNGYAGLVGSSVEGSGNSNSRVRVATWENTSRDGPQLIVDLVPEPHSILLACFCALGLMARRHRRGAVQ